MDRAELLRLLRDVSSLVHAKADESNISSALKLLDAYWKENVSSSEDALMAGDLLLATEPITDGDGEQAFAPCALVSKLLQDRGTWCTTCVVHGSTLHDVDGHDLTPLL